MSSDRSSLGLPGAAAALALAIGLLLPRMAPADERSSLRSEIALAVFPRVVAVDSAVADKLSTDGHLHLVLVFDEDANKADRLSRRLATDAVRIRQWPTRVSSAPARRLPELGEIPSAIFIVEPLADATFEQVVAFGSREHRMVFSPFLGDVERGAMAGLDIGVNVVPYLNMKSLGAAAIELDPRILAISKIHE